MSAWLAWRAVRVFRVDVFPFRIQDAIGDLKTNPGPQGRPTVTPSKVGTLSASSPVRLLQAGLVLVLPASTDAAGSSARLMARSRRRRRPRGRNW